MFSLAENAVFAFADYPADLASCSSYHLINFYMRRSLLRTKAFLGSKFGRQGLPIYEMVCLSIVGLLAHFPVSFEAAVD